MAQKINNENAVRVKATDFNGESFDGSPFSACPEWLLTAIQEKHVAIHPGGGRDYALFDVITPDGLKIAEPDNWIVYLNGQLFVMENNDYLTRFFV